MAYYEEVTTSDLMDLISELSGGDRYFELSNSNDIKRFANAYFRFAKYDYFDVLATLLRPVEMTRWFKRFAQIDLELEPDDTPELNHRFIQFICTRVTMSYDLFCESTIRAMQYFFDENIDAALSGKDDLVQELTFEEFINAGI